MFDKLTWLYNEKNELIEKAYYQYSFQDSKPYLSIKTKDYFKYENNLLIEKLTEVKGIVIDRKTEYIYDESKNLIFEIESELGPDDKFYVLKIITQKFNSDNKIIEKEVEDFSYYADENSLEQWTYDKQGNLGSYTQFEFNENYEFIPSYKVVYTYDAIKKANNISYFDYDEETKKWELDYFEKIFISDYAYDKVILPKNTNELLSLNYIVNQYWLCGDENCKGEKIKFQPDFRV